MPFQILDQFQALSRPHLRCAVSALSASQNIFDPEILPPETFFGSLGQLSVGRVARQSQLPRQQIAEPEMRNGNRRGHCSGTLIQATESIYIFQRRQPRDARLAIHRAAAAAECKNYGGG